jgi:predicted permease
MLVSRPDREFLVADLDEEYERRRANGQRALPWYLAHALHAAVTRRTVRVRHLERRASGGERMGQSVLTDLRMAWRSCLRQPGVTTAIVCSLGLGLGAAMAIFSVVRAVLLAPLPYRQPDRLVTVWSKLNGVDRTWLSSTDVRDVRRRSGLSEDLAMWTWDRVALTGLGDAASLTAGVVTANTFDVLGATPLYGRVFTQDEALAATKSGQALFAVLGYRLWRSTFAGDPGIVGRSITINDRPVTILGVMPQRFQLPTDFKNAAPTDLWTPLYNDPAVNEGGNSYFGAARLREHASLAAFNSELAAFATDFVSTGRYPSTMQFSLFAQAIDDDVFGGVRPAMRVLIAAVFVLLLIACANAAALLVARAEARRREWATRVALGAGRWRLLRLQFAEASLLSFAGGALGIGVAWLAIRTLTLVGLTTIPRANDVTIDWRVIVVMFALSAVATILSSLAPAVHAVRLNTVDGLKDGSRSASASRARLRLRALLVIAQLSCGMLLLTGAGLLARSLLAMQQIELGFDPADVLTARVELPPSRYSRADEVNTYVTALTARLRQLPGVRAAGLVRVLPLAQTIGNWPVTVEGYAAPPGAGPTGDWQVATPGALEALGERLLRGRPFSDGDTATSPVVALVNETMARAYWPGRDPIGRRLRFSNDSPLVWGTVVGIVGDVRHNGLMSAVRPKFYLPYAQFVAATGDKPVTAGTIVVRANGASLSQLATLRSAAAGADRDVPLSAVRPMTDVVNAALGTSRLTSYLVTGFAGVALGLSALGLFGLLTYLVTLRAHEIGIRMAIGASAAEIARMVVSQSLRVCALGLTLGLVLSAVAVRGLSNLLYGVRPWDPLVWTVAPAVLLAVAAVASLVPARRAAEINPLRALRQV